MADKYQKTPNTKNMRSPGSIVNQQHHDKSLSERDVAGSPGTFGPNDIISNSATLQPVKDHAIIRVMNTTGTMQFLFIGDVDDAPAGPPDISTGIAIPPNFYENLYCGKLANGKSVHIKSSDNGVQVIDFEL